MKKSKIEALKKVKEGQVKLEESLISIDKKIKEKEIKDKAVKTAKDVSRYSTDKFDKIIKSEKAKKVIDKVNRFAGDKIDKLKKK